MPKSCIAVTTGFKVTKQFVLIYAIINVLRQDFDKGYANGGINQAKKLHSVTTDFKVAKKFGLIYATISVLHKD